MSDTAAMNVLGAIDYKEGSTLVVRHSIDLLRVEPSSQRGLLELLDYGSQHGEDLPMACAWLFHARSWATRPVQSGGRITRLVLSTTCYRRRLLLSLHFADSRQCCSPQLAGRNPADSWASEPWLKGAWLRTAHRVGKPAHERPPF